MPRRVREWRSGQPSLADVAGLAGVSAQTVSRVVNNSARVGPETRARVEQAVARLGYRPHTGARSLATNAFASIGILCFDLTKFGNLHIVDAAITGARDGGYGVYLGTIPEATSDELQAAVRGLTDLAVDGLLIVEARILDTPSLTLPPRLPLVVAEGSRELPHAVVGIDHAAGARAVVEHLLSLGHRTVHHISGLPSSYPAIRRQATWEQVLHEQGRTVCGPVAGDWSAASGLRAAHQLLDTAAIDGREPVTAIFAANDQMAAGALRAAAERGIEVARELSVVGYDDAEFGAFLAPPLTTVRQDLRAVGRRAIELLLRAAPARETLAASVDLIQPELVLRESTAPTA
jgi:DNA-binding LacI/PurR family transcriptional regulator